MAGLNSYKEKAMKKDADEMSAVIGGSDKIYIHGDIDVNVPTQIMCNVEGNISSDAKIVISTNGIIKGDVKAAELIVEAGRVTGNIIADKVMIASGATVEGDVTTQSIAILEGASFVGTVRKPLVNGQSYNKPKIETPKQDGVKIAD